MSMQRNDLTELVATDVRLGLGDAFDLSTEGLQPLDSFAASDEPIASSAHDVLAWQWEGRHIGTLAGVPPTGRSVVVQGVTIVDHRGDEPWFHRFVDWLGVFDQLGAVLVTRPAVDAFPVELPGPDEGERVDDDTRRD